mmetsp:Transcript_2433/g.4927  ORF Transcript_2433/g.4927 Transcript_2433/m.4927 type:complete len:205 (+) Transcript_2433:430-1044(+)
MLDFRAKKLDKVPKPRSDAVPNHPVWGAGEEEHVEDGPGRRTKCDVVSSHRHDEVVVSRDVVSDEGVLYEQALVAIAERRFLDTCHQGAHPLLPFQPLLSSEVHPVRDILDHAGRFKDTLVPVHTRCCEAFVSNLRLLTAASLEEPMLIVEARVSNQICKTMTAVPFQTFANPHKVFDCVSGVVGVVQASIDLALYPSKLLPVT